MGMAVGSLFVKNHFNHESKVVALEMIHGIRESFNELLAENHWMDDATRLGLKVWETLNNLTSPLVQFQHIIIINNNRDNSHD